MAIESVQGALTRGIVFIQSLTEQMIEKGYGVTWVRVNANKHGVAQNRPRFFFVAHKVAIPWAKPTARMVVVADVFHGLEVEVDAQDKKRRLKSWYKKIPQGAVAIKVWNETHDADDAKRDELGRVVGRPAFTIRRISMEKRAPVLLHNAIHPTLNRYVTPNEAKAIMGFPQSFETFESGSSAVVLLTRGVCPPVGAWLGRQLSNALDEPRRAKAELREVNFS